MRGSAYSPLFLETDDTKIPNLDIADADGRHGGKIDTLYLDPSLGLIHIRANLVQGRWVSALHRSSHQPCSVVRVYIFAARKRANCRDDSVLGSQLRKNSPRLQLLPIE